MHMAAEYHDAKDNVIKDLQVFQNTFDPILARAAWNLSQPQLKTALKGITEVPIIKGVKIMDDRGNVLRSSGVILNQKKEIVRVDDDGQQSPEKQVTKDQLFWHTFPIMYPDRGKMIKIGEGTFYSSTSIVFEKVQYGFMFIIANAMIKTIALWIIFLWVSRYLLTQPLAILTSAASKLNMNSLENVYINVKTSGRNELKILEESFNSMVRNLLTAKNQLDDINHNLEEQVKHRTHELEMSLSKLEQQNTALSASNRKLEDLNGMKEKLLEKISALQHTQLTALEDIFTELEEKAAVKLKTLVRQASRKVHQIQDVIRPISSLYDSEKSILDKKVLLAETNKKQQVIAKMALGGTGVALDIVSTVEEGKDLLEKGMYDVLCINPELISLATHAHDHYPETRSVFMTSEDLPEYLPFLIEHTYLSNIVSRDDENRMFTLKNIITTVSKLVSGDLFGMEKYLNWGADIREHRVVSSETRLALLERMEVDLRKLGVRRGIISHCAMVAEELLMNAIYDAPVDANGKALYNHLPRTVEVELGPHEEAVFRYACDGVLIGVSVEDPFGALDNKTILNYLESCYSGKGGSLNLEKGGAGRGLFQIMETADLVIINVRPKVKTEVIAMFNTDHKMAKEEKKRSFHYFCY